MIISDLYPTLIKQLWKKQIKLLSYSVHNLDDIKSGGEGDL